MFEFIFGAFFLLMVVQILIFLFLNLPFPKSWKSVIFKTVAESQSLKTFLKIQILLCILAGFFYYDMVGQQSVYLSQKNKLKTKTSFGAELKRSTLSYQILKVQRNKYINFIVIFTFIVTVIFFWIKQQRYELQYQFKEQLSGFDKNHPELVTSQ